MRSYELMQNMIDEDLSLLWMSGTAHIHTYIHTMQYRNAVPMQTYYRPLGAYSRPETLILWTVPVPPVPIRPSVQQDLGGGIHTYIHTYILYILTCSIDISLMQGRQKMILQSKYRYVCVYVLY